MVEQFMWTDYILLGIIIGSTLFSVLRGFFREFTSLLTLGIAFFVAFKYGSAIASAINSITGKETIDQGLAMSGTFIVLLIILGKIFRRLRRKLFPEGKGVLDRLLGLCFGFTRGVLVSAFIIALTLFSPFIKGDQWQKTQVAINLKPVSNLLLSLIPDNMQQMVHQQVDGMEKNPVMIQTKKLMNATIGTKFEIKEQSEKDKAKEEEQAKEINQKQLELNETINLEVKKPAVAPVEDKSINRLYNERSRGNQEHEKQRKILLQKQRELELQRLELQRKQQEIEQKQQELQQEQQLNQ